MCPATAHERAALSVTCAVWLASGRILLAKKIEAGDPRRLVASSKSQEQPAFELKASL